MPGNVALRGFENLVNKWFEPTLAWYSKVMITTTGLKRRLIVAGAAAMAIAAAPVAGTMFAGPAMADPPPCYGENGGACVGPGGAGVAVPGAGAVAGPGGAGATVPGAGAMAGPDGAGANVPGAGVVTGPGGASANVPGANANAGPGGAGFCINGWCANAG